MKYEVRIRHQINVERTLNAECRMSKKVLSTKY